MSYKEKPFVKGKTEHFSLNFELRSSKFGGVNTHKKKSACPKGASGFSYQDLVD